MSLKRLKKVKNNEIKRFSLKRLKTKAKVVSIHDGDTCDLAFYRKKEMVRFNCRLEDVDAPELDEANGKLVRDFLAHLCLGKDPKEFDDSRQIWDRKTLQRELDKSQNLVHAVFGDDGKYGRALVTLKRSSQGGKSINKMITDYKSKMSDSSSTSSDSSDASESSNQD